MYQTFYNEAFNQSGMGTGQSTQRAITAATAAIQALAGGDIKAAIAGGAAPYIANAIANAFTRAGIWHDRSSINQYLLTTNPDPFFFT